MAAKKSQGDTVIKFYMPSLTKDKKKIPSEKREKYINAIAKSFSNLNGGATLIPSCKGIYLSKDNEYDYEDITIIETHGRNPFSEKEMSFLCEELNQECILVRVAGNNDAYFFSAEEPKDLTKYDEVVFADGSRKLIHPAQQDPDDPNGELVHLVEEFDESGDLTGSGYVQESTLIMDENPELMEDLYDFMDKHSE